MVQILVNLYEVNLTVDDTADGYLFLIHAHNCSNALVREGYVLKKKWRATSDQWLSTTCKGIPTRWHPIVPTLKVRLTLKDVTSTTRCDLVEKTVPSPKIRYRTHTRDPRSITIRDSMIEMLDQDRWCHSTSNWSQKKYFPTSTKSLEWIS